jgi:hypothetical protein
MFEFAIQNKNPNYQGDPFSILIMNGYKHVNSLKAKNGRPLGEIYVKENPKYSTKVLTTLLVVKLHGLKLDTVYQINSRGQFINVDGKVEKKNCVKVYYGFKLVEDRKKQFDSFSVGYVDSNGKLYSDDNDHFIYWEDTTGKFVYYPMP